MTTILAKYISKKILGETIKNNFGSEDPYFEQVPATRLDGSVKPGKFKKQRKALPPGISEQDGKVLTKVKRRAWRLDMSLFNCCGIRFGWSSVIGIVPVFGDILDVFMAMMVVRTCDQVEGGLPASVKSRMLFNVVVDFLIGLVPLMGDVADALFRANTRNAAVLEEYLREKGKKTLRKSGIPLPAVDPSDPDQFDMLHSEDSLTTRQPAKNAVMSAAAQHEGTTASSHSHGGIGSRQGTTGSGIPTPHGRSATGPTQPGGVRTRDERAGKHGVFGFLGRERPVDEEMGNVAPQSSRAPRKPQRP